MFILNTKSFFIHSASRLRDYCICTIFMQEAIKRQQGGEQNIKCVKILQGAVFVKI